MKKNYVFFLGFLFFAVFLSNCDKMDIEKKNSIIYRKLDSVITIELTDQIINDTITVEFENDSILKKISFIYRLFKYYDCDYCQPDTIYSLYIELGQNKMTGCELGYPGTPYPIESDSLVNDHYNYYNKIMFYYEASFLNWYFNYFQLNSMKSNYYGLKLFQNNQSYYGWIKLNFSDENKFEVVEYAYQTDKNKSIIVGQKD